MPAVEVTSHAASMGPGLVTSCARRMDGMEPEVSGEKIGSVSTVTVLGEEIISLILET